MKDEDVEFLVRAASELLKALDDEDIAVDLTRSKGTLGFIRGTMNDVMIALFPFDDLLEDDGPVDEALVSATRN